MKFHRVELLDLEDDGEMPSSFSSGRFLINLKLYSPLAAVLSPFPYC